jgi:excisionase family DNA binding protein
VYFYQTLDGDRLVMKWKYLHEGPWEHTLPIPEGATIEELRALFREHFGDDIALGDDRRIDIRCPMQAEKNGDWYLLGDDPDDQGDQKPDTGRHSRFLIAAEVAKLLRESERTVRRWADAGVLPAVRVGRRWLFEEKEIEKAIARGRSAWKSC